MNSPDDKPDLSAGAITDILNIGHKAAFLHKHGRKLAVIVAVLVVVWLIWPSGSKKDASGYTTESASMGKLVVKVSATGKLQPTNQVDVGSELSGIVEEVFVEENDHVKKGQPLARLDLSRLQDAVTESHANLVAAEAQVLQAKATLEEKSAVLERFRKVSQLSEGKVPSQDEMSIAEADVKRARAAEASALAAVTQAKAVLKSNETSLSKGYIRSPINGLVLDRAIEPGQTMAASFNAPVLFTLAEDLTKMELQVDIDEADVGEVKVGQSAVFSVDAWPDRQYPASIIRVGYGAQEVDGVVSYPATLSIDNGDLSLRPGMTATADITTIVRDNVLLVPNAALRFSPSSGVAEAASSKRSPISSLMPRPPRTVKKLVSTVKKGESSVWVLEQGQPREIAVKTGASNGSLTEITSGDLKPGMAVITDEGTPAQ